MGRDLLFIGHLNIGGIVGASLFVSCGQARGEEEGFLGSLLGVLPAKTLGLWEVCL